MIQQHMEKWNLGINEYPEVIEGQIIEAGDICGGKVN